MSVTTCIQVIATGRSRGGRHSKRATPKDSPFTFLLLRCCYFLGKSLLRMMPTLRLATSMATYWLKV